MAGEPLETKKLKVAAENINKVVGGSPIIIRNTYTAAQIKSTIEAAMSDNMSIEFESGEYILDEYAYMYGFKELMINFNGAVFKSTMAGGGVLAFCTNEVDADKYFRIPGADPSWFVSDMPKGVHYIEITDPDDWGTVNKGDIILIGDEREVPGVLNSMGLLLIFNRFEEVEGVWRMYFDYRSRGDLQCKTNLKYVDTFGGGYYVCRVPVKGNVRAINGTFDNCQLTLQGFKSAITDKIIMKQTVFPFASDDQAAFGLNPTYCKDIIINNDIASGFNQTGYGYGIVSGVWDKMIISNYIPSNNKHSFTTSTTYYHFNNILKYVNVLSSSTVDQQDNDSTNGSPIDQHAGVWEVEVEGLSVDGSRPAVHYQGVNNTLRGLNLYNCKLGITSDIGEVANQTKEWLIIDSCIAKNMQGSFFLHGSNVNLDNLLVTNTLVDFSNADITKDVFAFKTADPTCYVKNLTVKDSEFIGRKRNRVLTVSEDFINISNNNDTAGFDNIVVRHTKIKNFRYILRSGLPKMTSVLFDDCDIENFVSLLSTSNITTVGTVGYNDVLFRNCRISVGFSLIDMTSSKFMLNNVRFENCEFNFIANNIVNMANNIINRLEFSGNEFRNSFYGATGRFILFSGGGCNYILEENNTFYKHSQTDIDAVILAYANTGYVETGTPKYTCMGAYVTKVGAYPTEYDQIDNKYYTDGWNEGFIRLAGGKGKNCGNKFFVSLIHTRFMELNGRDSDVHSNLLVLSSALANSEFIRSLTAGVTVKAIGNTIINNSASGTMKLLYISGINYYEGGNNKFKVNVADSIVDCTLLEA